MAQELGLPINEAIEHNGRTLKISGLISDDGYTSRVYEGWLSSDDGLENIHVAIKLMKPLDFSHAREKFEQEGGVLSSLMYYETEANKEQRLDLKVAPIYYGSGEFDGVPYLVMEFISGRRLPDLIDDSGGKLDEKQALIIAWHLFRTFDILHNRLKKSYADLKYENLWWVSNNGTNTDGILKLMDFGTMEDISQAEETSRGVRRDLLQAGVYLCHMVTGKMPEYSMTGFLRERAEPIIKGSRMSWGTRQLLFRLLHRNPNARPPDASSLIPELRRLVSFWVADIEALLGIANDLLVKAETMDETQSSNRYDLAVQARSAFDIAQIRNPGDQRISEDIERTNKILSLSDYLERGKTLLKTRSPDLARKSFEQGMHYSDEPAVLRRWSYLARVGEKISPKVFDEFLSDAMEMVDWINEGDLTHAVERLEKLKPNLDSPGLDMLESDIHLFKNINKARLAVQGAQKNYDVAASHYREAMQWMEKLPDKDFIKEEEEGDLYQLAREMEICQETDGKAIQLMEEAINHVNQSNLDSNFIIDHVHQAISLSETNRDLQDRLVFLIESLLEIEKYTLSFYLVSLIRRKIDDNEKLNTLLHITKNLHNAEEALARGDHNLLLHYFRKVRTDFKSNPIALSSLKKLINLAVERANARKDLVLLERIAKFSNEHNDFDLAQEFWKITNEVKEQRDADLRKTIDTLISDSTNLLQIDEFNPKSIDNIISNYSAQKIRQKLCQKSMRFDEIDQKIADAEKIIEELDYRRNDIDQLRERLNMLRSSVDHELISLDDHLSSEYQAQLDAIFSSRDRLEKFLEWANGANDAGAQGQVVELISKQAEQDALELIRRCHVFLANIDGTNEQVQELLETTLLKIGNLGQRGWDNLREKAEEHNQVINQKFSQAKQAFEQGHLEQLAFELDLLSNDFGLSSEWQSLKIKFTKVEMLNSLMKEHNDTICSGQIDPAFLKSIREFANLGLPKIYYRNLEEYLNKAYATVRDETENYLQHHESEEFLENLRLWVNVELTRRLVTGN